ncbi:hypothetical protein [Thermoleptolyngbya sp.]
MNRPDAIGRFLIDAACGKLSTIQTIERKGVSSDDIKRWIAWIGVGVMCSTAGAIGVGMDIVQALPPPEDVPEEVLRTQIVLEGRSPVTGEPLSAGDRATQQANRQTAIAEQPRALPPEVQQIVMLLKLQRLLRPVPIQSHR